MSKQRLVHLRKQRKISIRDVEELVASVSVPQRRIDTGLTEERQRIRLREVIQQERLEAEAREELRAELMTLQAQAASPKPKWAIIKATVGSIKAVLENAAGGVLSAKALPYLTALL